jgi:hypothetical protein
VMRHFADAGNKRTKNAGKNGALVDLYSPNR